MDRDSHQRSEFPFGQPLGNDADSNDAQPQPALGSQRGRRINYEEEVQFWHVLLAAEQAFCLYLLRYVPVVRDSESTITASPDASQ